MTHTLHINSFFTSFDARKSFSRVCDVACDNHENVLVKRTGKKDKNVVLMSSLLQASSAFVSGKKDKEVVLMSYADFQQLQETLYLLNEPANATHLKHSLEQAKNTDTLHPDPTEV